MLCLVKICTGKKLSYSMNYLDATNACKMMCIFEQRVHCDCAGHILTLSSPVCHITNQDFSDCALFFCPLAIPCGVSHHLFSLFFADWIGKCRSLLLLQLIQFKVKWCVLSQMSFCTLLLYQAVIYLWPVNSNKFCRSPMTSLVSHWGGGSERRE